MSCEPIFIISEPKRWGFSLIYHKLSQLIFSIEKVFLILLKFHQ